MKKLSLDKLLASLSRSAEILNSNTDSSLTDNQKVGTTIRLEPEVRNFIESQAHVLGVSLHDVISMILKGVMLSTVNPLSIREELLIDRFFEIFHVHGITLEDIPSFFQKEKIKASNLKNRTQLIELIDDETLDKMSSIFSVEKDWLEGVSDNPSDPLGFQKRWYKNSAILAENIFNVLKNKNEVKLMFLVSDKTTQETLAAAINSKDFFENPCTILVGLEINHTGYKVPFTSYEIWPGESWDYPATRHFLKCILMFCQEARIPFTELSLSRSDFSKVKEGKMLLIEALKKRRGHPEIHFPKYIQDTTSNPEQHELKSVQKIYQDYRFSEFIPAICQSYDYKNWKDFNEKTHSNV